jgi:hypothetical protein
MFHLGMWRERMRNALTDLAEGRTPQPPPPIEQQDEFNDAELANGIGTPLADAAARSDHLLAEIVALYEKLGDRTFQWYRWNTTSDAVLGNSYTHPRLHMYGYLLENGERDRAFLLWEDAVGDLAQVSPVHLGTAKYNLACVRVQQGKRDEALDLLAEAFLLRSELKAHALTDADVQSLRGEARFQELTK